MEDNLNRAIAPKDNNEAEGKNQTYNSARHLAEVGDGVIDKALEQCVQEWQAVCSRLRAELGEGTFQAWFARFRVVGVREGTVTLAVPTAFIKSYIENHYIERMQTYWQEKNPNIKALLIIVGESEGTPAPRLQARPFGVAPAPQAPKVESKALPEPIGVRLNKNFTFDNFVVGKSNEFAYAAAKRVCELNNDSHAHNPLFLYGGSGLGKTHLLHAIAWQMRRTAPEQNVVYIPAERFMYHFVRAMRSKDTMAFKEQFRDVDVLMVDDLQFFVGKHTTQEEFFHTFNALIDRERKVILAADRAPNDLDGIEERIRSRLGSGLSADIHKADYELRLGILQAKADARPNREVDVPHAILSFLAQNIVDNVRTLEGALNKVITHADFVGLPITLDMTKDALRDILRASQRQVGIDEIQRHVATFYSIRQSDMLSVRRARAVARPRQIAMYLCKQLTTRSLPEIGRKFGGRDHTTVIHAVKKVEALQQDDQNIREDLALLMQTLDS